jgi:hypothetical protein
MVYGMHGINEKRIRVLSRNTLIEETILET